MKYQPCGKLVRDWEGGVFPESRWMPKQETMGGRRCIYQRSQWVARSRGIMSRWVLRYGPIMSNARSDSGHLFVWCEPPYVGPDGLIPRACNPRRAEKGHRGRGSRSTAGPK